MCRDRLTVGRKLREARRTGYPQILLFGRKSADPLDPQLELHNTQTGAVLDLRPAEIMEHLQLPVV